MDTFSILLTPQGNGVFARKFISAGEEVCVYGGTELSVKDSKNVKSNYLFEIGSGETAFCLDHTENTPFSIGQLINHSKPHPNLYLQIIRENGKNDIKFRAKRNIPVGVQLSWNYGKEFPHLVS